MEEYQVKKIEPSEEELEQIMAIWLEANIEAHPFIEENYWESNYSDVKEQISNADIYVCCDDNQIVGFLGLLDTYIAGLFVKNTFRKHGIGSALIEEAKRISPVLKLSVYKKNHTAYLFYLSQKFDVVEATLDQAVNEKEYTMMWQRNVVN